MNDIPDFIRRYAAAWASRKDGAMAELWDPDGELHHPALSAPIPGSLVPANNDNTKRQIPEFEWSLLDWARRRRLPTLAKPRDDRRGALRVDIEEGPLLEPLTAELSRKYLAGADIGRVAVTSGYRWLFELAPRS